MSDEELEKWLAAGEAVRRALERALDIVQAGVSVLRVAQELEAEVAKQGAEPAFPANISINEVAAHYSPGIDDPSTVPEGGVVKVDVGAHVDGYIADAAITIALDPRYEPLSEAAARALQAALAVLKPGVDLCAVGRSVEGVARAAGFRPVANLTGHLMQRYVLHAGKHVPNVASQDCDRATLGEVYAVEPFVTDGRGYVVEGRGGAIYRLVNLRRVGDERLDGALKTLWSRYRGLPFSERWLQPLWGAATAGILRELVELRRVYRYPVLIEAGRGAVAQFEDTVALTRRGVVNTTRVLELLRV